MGQEFSGTAEFRGASFERVDFTGARFRNCDFTGVAIVSCDVAGVRVAGFGGGIASLVVDDVDVTAYVSGELDRRFPERVQVREMRTPAEHRSAWTTVERLWAATLEDAERLPVSTMRQRVDGEWSFLETVRHLLFASDIWLGRMLLEEPAPFHRLGLPPSDYPAKGAADLGIDLDATPTLAEVAAAHADRRTQFGDLLDKVTEDDLARTRTTVLAPAWGEETFSVAAALRVMIREHCEHRRFAVRDLATLRTGTG
jgi:uncharacterized damage-inducible protein DinB